MNLMDLMILLSQFFNCTLTYADFMLGFIDFFHTLRADSIESLEVISSTSSSTIIIIKKLL